MREAKEIVNHILMMDKANKLKGVENNIEEMAKIIYNYKHDLGEFSKDKNMEFRQPDDRRDSPHHHSNRLD